MLYFVLRYHICKSVCALVAAALMLPVLAFAGGHDSSDRKDENRWGDHDTHGDRDRHIPVVPETNAGWMLVPFFGAVLLFSARRFYGAEAGSQ
jgi:hypothetical protein